MSRTNVRDYNELKACFISEIEKIFAKEVENNQNKKGKYGVRALLPKELDKHDVKKGLDKLGYSAEFDEYGDCISVLAYKIV